MTTNTIASPTSAPASAPSAPASAPAAAPSPAPATPTQGAAKPTPAPSKPQNVVKNSIGRPDRRGANDPMKVALEKARAAPAPQQAPTGGDGEAAKEATAQPTATVSPADRAKAALSTTAKPTEPQAQKAPAAAEPAQPQSQPLDPAKELEVLRRSNSDFGRKLQTMNQELAEHREHRATAAKEAEALKLKPYMAGHPEHQATLSKVMKADAFDAALSIASTEQQNDPAYRAQLARKLGVSNADLQLRDEWKSHKENVSAQFAADPEGTIRKEAERVAQSTFNQMWERRVQEDKVRQDVNRDLADPEVRNFAKANPADFQRVLEATGHNTEWAAHHIKLFAAYNTQAARIEELESRIGDSDAKAGMATEQQRLLKARTTVAREPVAKTVGDPLKAAKAWAIENGITPSMSHPQFRAKLSEYHAAKSNPGNA